MLGMTVPLLILALAVICATLAVAMGKGDPMPEVVRDLPPMRVPADSHGAVRTLDLADLDRVRFPVVLRGYRMAAVEAVLDRLRDQLEASQREIQQLRQQALPASGEALGVPPTPAGDVLGVADPLVAPDIPDTGTTTDPSRPAGSE